MTQGSEMQRGGTKAWSQIQVSKFPLMLCIYRSFMEVLNIITFENIYLL
jgi:hypothetical protein